MSPIDVEKIKKIDALDVEIRNIQGYFSFGRRHVWLNPTQYTLETNWEMFCRALTIISIVPLFFKLYTFFHVYMKKKEIQATLSPFDFLPNELILVIQELCPFKERLALTETCRRHQGIYRSDVHFQLVENITKGLSLATARIIEAPYVCLVEYHPLRQEIMTGRIVNSEITDSDYVTVYDRNLTKVDHIPFDESYWRGNRDQEFSNSINAIYSTAEGDVIVILEESFKAMYWNRRTKKLYRIAESHDDKLKLVCHPQGKRYYIGSMGKVKVYEETEQQQNHIDTIQLPLHDKIKKMEIDKKLNLLWIVSGGFFYEYDLESTDLRQTPLPFETTTNFFWDAEEHWLIGSIDNQTVGVWDTQKKTLIKEIKTPDRPIHYDKSKKWVFLLRYGVEDGTIPERVRIWDLNTHSLIDPQLERPKIFNGLDEIDFDSKSNVLMMCDGDGHLCAWDMKNKTLLTGQLVTAHGFIWDKVNALFISMINENKDIDELLEESKLFVFEYDKPQDQKMISL